MVVKKKSKLKIKNIVLLLLVIVTVVAASKTVYAYLNAKTDEVKNSFSLKDIKKPTVESFTVQSASSSFTLTLKAVDTNSGINKINWYYKGCNDSDYTLLSTTEDINSTEEITKTISSDSCLSYCTYYAYAVVIDNADNETTTDILEFSTNPTTANVSYDDTNNITECTTVKCVIEELNEKLN